MLFRSGCTIPTSINVHLHVNNECLKDHTEITVSDISSDTPWTWSFTDLPKYDQYGKLFEWEVHEEPIKNFTSERVVTQDGKYNIMNTFNPGKISIEVEKHWIDGDNRDNTRPQEITVKVKRNDTQLNSLTLNAENSWRAKLDNIENTGEFAIEDFLASGEILYWICENLNE